MSTQDSPSSETTEVLEENTRGAQSEAPVYDIEKDPIPSFAALQQVRAAVF
jgi:hypothetical protein